MVLCGFLMYGASQKFSFTLKKQTRNPTKPKWVLPEVDTCGDRMGAAEIGYYVVEGAIKVWKIFSF